MFLTLFSLKCLPVGKRFERSSGSSVDRVETHSFLEKELQTLVTTLFPTPVRVSVPGTRCPDPPSVQFLIREKGELHLVKRNRDFLSQVKRSTNP